MRSRPAMAAGLLEPTCPSALIACTGWGSSNQNLEDPVVLEIRLAYISCGVSAVRMGTTVALGSLPASLSSAEIVSGVPGPVCGSIANAFWRVTTAEMCSGNFVLIQTGQFGQFFIYQRHHHPSSRLIMLTRYGAALPSKSVMFVCRVTAPPLVNITTSPQLLAHSLNGQPSYTGFAGRDAVSAPAIIAMTSNPASSAAITRYENLALRPGDLFVSDSAMSSSKIYFRALSGPNTSTVVQFDQTLFHTGR